MNKYEMRAEAVLKKKEEYLKKRENKMRIAVTFFATAACIAASVGVAAAFNSIVRPPAAQQIIYVYAEAKNYGNFRTFYVNEKNEENVFTESTKFGILDAEGNVVLPPVYDNAVAVGNNCFIVEKVNSGVRESALVDSDGKVIFDYFKGNLLPVFHEGNVRMLIVDESDGTDFLIDTDGEAVLDIGFENLFYAHTTGWAGYESTEAVKGISNNKYYLIDYTGKVIGIFGEEPSVKKSYGNGINLTAAYRPYSGNYKTLLFGACDDSGREIVPCEYPTLNFTGDRFIGRRGDEQGLDPHDVVVIYDTDGNVVCESGRFHNISFDYRAETGIGVVMGEWSDELMMSIGGCWVIDKNGNKLSEEYDRIEKNSDGTYTAYSDGHTVIRQLDSRGKIIE